MKPLKTLLTGSLSYGMAQYLSVFAAVFLTPIYTRILTKEDYGAMDVYNTFVTLAVLIVPLGLNNAILRFYPDIKDNPEKRNKTLGSMLVLFLGLCGLFIITGVFSKTLFIETFIGQKGYDHIFWLAISVVCLSIILAFHLTLLRVRFEKGKFLMVSILNFLLLSSLGFVMVYYYKMGVAGFFCASIIALSTAIILGFFFNRKEFRFTFSRTYARPLLKYSVHFLGAFLLFETANMIDRYLIKEFVSLEDVGSYSIAARVGTVMKMAVGSFALVWIPYALSIKNRPNALKTYTSMFNVFIAVGLALAGTLILFRSELIAFLAPDYFESYNTMMVLVMNNFFSGFALVFTIGIQISMKTKFMTLSAVFSVIVNVLVSLALLEDYGILGVATGTLAGTLVWIGILHFFSQRLYHIPYQYMGNLMLLALFSVGIIFFSLEEENLADSPALLLSIKFLLTGLLVAMAYVVAKRNAGNIDLSLSDSPQDPSNRVI